MFITFNLQRHQDIGVDTKHSHMSGINFPISQEAMLKLEQLKNHEITYVQLVGLNEINKP